MKHITIDCRMWGKKYGGIGRYTKEIVTFLVTHYEWKFTLLCSQESYFDLSQLSTKNIHLKHCKSNIFSFKEQWEIWLKVPPCDIFWSPYMNIPFIPTRAKKQIVTLHDVFHIANPQYYKLIKRLCIYPYYFFSIKYSNLILTVSEFSKKEISHYFGNKISKKIISVYNGCEIPIINTEKSINNKYFLFVGSIKPHKNLKNALLGFMRLDNDFKFIIVGRKDGFITGDKDVFNLVSEINKEKERVLFTGNITNDELYEWYKGASALIMPSFYEGFGLPIIEAMHFNLPVLCSNIPIFKEICGEQVTYFNPSDPSDIYTKMNNFIHSNISEKKYKKWNTWSETANKIGVIIQNLF